MFPYVSGIILLLSFIIEVCSSQEKCRMPWAQQQA